MANGSLQAMERLTAYCYSLSAAAFAIFVTWADNAKFWEDRLWCSVILAFAIPVNLAAGWLIAHRPVRVPVWFYKVYCIGAVGIGLVGLALFMFGVNDKVGLAFLLGIAGSFSMLDGLFDPYPQSLKEGREDQKDQSNPQ